MSISLCIYGCNTPAQYYLGKKQTPCCQPSIQRCPAHKAKRHQTTLASEGGTCFYCTLPAKYLLGKKKTPCCSPKPFECSSYIAKLKNRSMVRKNPRKPRIAILLPSTQVEVCAYCRGKAAYLVGSKKTPCCTPSVYSCLSIKEKTSCKDMWVAISGKADCFYGCGQLALYLIGKKKKPCCAKSPNSCPSSRKKKIATNLERLGVQYPFSSPEVRKKAEATCLQRFGGNPMSNKAIKEKKDLTNLAKFGLYGRIKR